MIGRSVFDEKQFQDYKLNVYFSPILFQQYSWHVCYVIFS